MEEGEFSSDSELAQSVLEVPTIDWVNYRGVKRAQYIKIVHASRIQALEPKNWDHKTPSGKPKKHSQRIFSC